MAEPEERTEEAIRVRQVTQVHSNWNEEERGAPGKFSFQLILDNGAEEFVIRPENEDADVLIDLFEQTGTIYFDLDRKVLIFGDVSVKPNSDNSSIEVYSFRCASTGSFLGPYSMSALAR